MWRSIFFVLVAGCGSGVHTAPELDAAASCVATGTGAVTGMSKGATIGPIARAFTTADSGMFGIVLDDQTGASSVCDTTRASTAGYYLVMAFCSPIAVGHYDAVAERDFHCPSSPYGLVKSGDTHDFADGAGGTIDIASTDGGCTTGMFSLEYDNGGTGVDTLTGTFAAVACP
jgi:hypothetical protein